MNVDTSSFDYTLTITAKANKNVNTDWNIDCKEKAFSI